MHHSSTPLDQSLAAVPLDAESWLPTGLHVWNPVRRLARRGENLCSFQPPESTIERAAGRAPSCSRVVVAPWLERLTWCRGSRWKAVFGSNCGISAFVSITSQGSLETDLLLSLLLVHWYDTSSRSTWWLRRGAARSLSDWPLLLDRCSGWYLTTRNYLFILPPPHVSGMSPFLRLDDTDIPLSLSLIWTLVGCRYWLDADMSRL